jgi:hypothetical protein
MAGRQYGCIQRAGPQLSTALDDNWGADRWEIARPGMRGVVNYAIRDILP